MESWVIATILILFVVVIGLCLYFMNRPKKKWSCKDGNCELIINGDFESEQKCLKRCIEKYSKTHIKKVRFADKRTEIDSHGKIILGVTKKDA